MKTTSGSVTEEGGGKRGLDSQQMKKVGGGIRPACGERVQMRVRNFVGYGLLHQIHHRRAGRVAGGRCSGDAGIRRDGCSPDRTKRGFFETCKKGRRENRFQVHTSVPPRTPISRLSVSLQIRICEKVNMRFAVARGVAREEFEGIGNERM